MAITAKISSQVERCWGKWALWGSRFMLLFKLESHSFFFSGWSLILSSLRSSSMKSTPYLCVFAIIAFPRRILHSRIRFFFHSLKLTFKLYLRKLMCEQSEIINSACMAAKGDTIKCRIIAGSYIVWVVKLFILWQKWALQIDYAWNG